VRLEGNVLTLAVADPMDDAVVQDVRFRTGKNTIAVVGPKPVSKSCSSGCTRSSRWTNRRMLQHLQGVNPSGEIEASGENEYE